MSHAVLLVTMTFPSPSHGKLFSIELLFGGCRVPYRIVFQEVYASGSSLDFLSSLNLAHASCTKLYVISACFVVSTPCSLHVWHLPSYPALALHSPTGSPPSMVSHTIANTFLGIHLNHNLAMISLRCFVVYLSLARVLIPLIVAGVLLNPILYPLLVVNLKKFVIGSWSPMSFQYQSFGSHGRSIIGVFPYSQARSFTPGGGRVVSLYFVFMSSGYDYSQMFHCSLRHPLHGLIWSLYLFSREDMVLYADETSPQLFLDEIYMFDFTLGVICYPIPNSWWVRSTWLPLDAWNDCCSFSWNGSWSRLNLQLWFCHPVLLDVVPNVFDCRNLILSPSEECGFSLKS